MKTHRETADGWIAILPPARRLFVPPCRARVDSARGHPLAVPQCTERLSNCLVVSETIKAMSRKIHPSLLHPRADHVCPATAHPPLFLSRSSPTCPAPPQGTMQPHRAASRSTEKVQSEAVLTPGRHMRSLHKAVLMLLLVVGAASAQTCPPWDLRGGDTIDGAHSIATSSPLVSTLVHQSVALSANGNIVAVGEPGFNSNQGRVRVYNWTGSVWSQLGTDINGASGSYAGASVSLSDDGSIVAMGAPVFGAGSIVGRVSVIVWNSTLQDWQPIVGGDIDGTSFGGAAGYSVSLSGDGSMLAVGSAGVIVPQRGSTTIYNYTGSGWVAVGTAIYFSVSDSDQVGTSVSLSNGGDIVAVGAPACISPNNAFGSAGCARVFKYNATIDDWEVRGSSIDAEGANHRTGTSVSLSSDGSVVAVSSPGYDNDKGRVRVYRFVSNTDWELISGSAINGGAQGDLAGLSVSLSADGNAVAIGSPGSISSTGRSVVYVLTGGSTWVAGENVDGDSTGDKEGTFVALSDDGSTLAVAAPNNTIAQVGAGYTRV